MRVDVVSLFAVVCVSDIEQGTVWYTRLFGRGPDERPMEGLVQWQFPGGAGVQLVGDAPKAGASLVTLVTPRLARTRRDLEARGLRLGPDVQGDYGLLAQLADPDGNVLTLAEPARSG